MSIPQTTVSSQFPIGVPGQLADGYTAQFGDVVTRTSEEASAEIPFGTIVKRGTVGDRCKMLTAVSDIPDGVVVFANMFDYPTERGDIGLKPKTTFGVLRKGRIYVLLETDVAITDEVHVRATANGANTTIGICRATADATHTIDLTGLASWAKAGVAGDVGILEVDMTLAHSAVAD